MYKYLLILSIGLNIHVNAQNKTVYQIFDKNGKKLSYEKMYSKLQPSEIILFGEIHNNPIAHWLQYELTNDFIQSKKSKLGAEMFEADNQKALNLYLKDSINIHELDSMARLWKNFSTDYAPLVNLAKENQLDFIATNVPRKYANTVYKKGFSALDSLNKEELQWIAPLPIKYDAELECYKNIMAAAHGHGGKNLPKAQALKDATMAYFILENYISNETFIHYNGTYHSEIFQGIVWYLLQENPNLKIATIATTLQENPNKLEKENYNIADFIIVVDENMTTTY